MNITFISPINLESDLAHSTQPALCRLVAHGKNHMLNQPMTALICQHFSVQAKPDYPLAALSSDVYNSSSADYYLQADPVHLVMQRDAFSLSDPSTLVITQSELMTLCAVLNQHFMSGGLDFEVSNKKLLLRLATVPRISTTLPESVVGRNVYAYLPQGTDASYWNKIVNEIQMLLHEHPLNQQREMAGLPVINSLWLSGGGLLPKITTISFNKVYSDIAYVEKLAQLAGLACQSLPIDKTFELNQESMLIVTKSTADSEAWFDVLYKLVQKGATLQLNLAHQDVVLVSEIKPSNLYKLRLLQILLKNKPIISYFQEYYARMYNKMDGGTKF